MAPLGSHHHAMRFSRCRFVISVFSLAWRLAWLSFNVTSQGLLRRLKRPLRLSMPKRMPTALTRAPEALSVHPSAYDQDPLDDYDPSEPGDPWSDYLNQPEVIHACRHHLRRCLSLNPARHDHKP